MCDVIKRNDIFDKTLEPNITIKTKINVKTFKIFIIVSRRLKSADEPDDSWTGGS